MISEAEAFIASTPPSKPFFLYLAFIEPHVAMHPPADEVDKFPRDWDPQPYQGENGYLPSARPRAAYAAMISMLDSYVGRIRTALDKSGASPNTLIVFTSDNGATHAGKPDSPFHIGGADPAFFNSTKGLRAFKGSIYEGGLRVPCIAHWPGKIPQGSVTAAPSYFADWFPTLCAASGTTPPDGLDGENLLELDVADRSKAGLFLAFQYPVEIPGVSVSNFLRTAKTAISGEAPSIRGWVKEVRESMDALRMDAAFTERNVNEGFSGGEKKRHEILQMELLKPKFAVLDETDSGLDVDALRVVADGVNRIKDSIDIGVLLITHYTRILKYIKPDFVHVFVAGQIAEQGGAELAERLEAEGYDRYVNA
jgi:Fe-S cluster assembly ATP-binding protein